jgi:hypothetical protein
VILRYSLLKRNVTEHPGLLLIVSAHKTKTLQNVPRLHQKACFSTSS